jgi:hypothetical protein
MKSTSVHSRALAVINNWWHQSKNHASISIYVMLYTEWDCQTDESVFITDLMLTTPESRCPCMDYQMWESQERVD